MNSSNNNGEKSSLLSNQDVFSTPRSVHTPETIITDNHVPNSIVTEYPPSSSSYNPMSSAVPSHVSWSGYSPRGGVVHSPNRTNGAFSHAQPIKYSTSPIVPTLKRSHPSSASFYEDSNQYVSAAHSIVGDFHSDYPIGILLENETRNFHSINPQISRHRGELSAVEKYRYDLSRSQLKASSRTSALLAGFAMVALVELQYEKSTPHGILILLAVITTLLVSVHLLALMMSTCLLPYIEANGCTKDSPHTSLKFYIDLSWMFSTCIGLVLFLLEIGVIFYMKFVDIDFEIGGYVTTAMLVPVLLIFGIISYLIHRSRVSHSVDRVGDKVDALENILNEAEIPAKLNNYFEVGFKKTSKLEIV